MVSAEFFFKNVQWSTLLFLDKCLKSALENIFEKLDEQSLYNAKLVSKKWNAAISEANLTPLWKRLLFEKVSILVCYTFPLFIMDCQIYSFLNCRLVYLLYGINSTTISTWKQQEMAWTCKSSFTKSSTLSK